MYIVEITEDKIEKLSDHLEKSLRHMGKAMQCVDDWMMEGSGHSNYRDGHYDRYGERSNVIKHSGPMTYRDDDWDEDDMHEHHDYMGERRRRDRRGRYM